MGTEQADRIFEQLKRKIKETWSQLSDEDLALYPCQSDYFFSKVKEQYGLTKADAEKKIISLEDACISEFFLSHAKAS